jgi:hypothetical protein
MAWVEDDDKLAQRLNEHIARAFNNGNETHLLARWVLVAETITDDDRMLHTIGNPEMPDWDLGGLLRAGLDEITSQQMAAALKDTGE